MRYKVKLLLLLYFTLIFCGSCGKGRYCTVNILCDEDVSKEECYKFYKEEIRKCERGEE